MSGDRSGEKPSAGAMSGEGEKLLGRSMEAKLRIEIASSKASSSPGGWIQELDLTRGSLGQALSHLQAGGWGGRGARCGFRRGTVKAA